MRTNKRVHDLWPWKYRRLLNFFFSNFQMAFCEKFTLKKKEKRLAHFPLKKQLGGGPRIVRNKYVRMRGQRHRGITAHPSGPWTLKSKDSPKSIPNPNRISDQLWNKSKSSSNWSEICISSYKLKIRWRWLDKECEDINRSEKALRTFCWFWYE